MTMTPRRSQPSGASASKPSWRSRDGLRSLRDLDADTGRRTRGAPTQSDRAVPAPSRRALPDAVLPRATRVARHHELREAERYRPPGRLRLRVPVAELRHRPAGVLAA